MARAGKMIDREIKSEYLDETMTIRIYEPERFTPLNKHHICIMLDGNDYYQLGRVATLSDRLHNEEVIENTVFAGIHYIDRYDRWDKYHPDGEKNEAFLKFLRFEAVPLLDKELNGYNVGYSRALMGDSLGGTVALMAALKYPNTFGKIIMQSPYVNDAVLKTVDESDAVKLMHIYHAIGKDENEVPVTGSKKTQDFVEPNRELHNYLKDKVSDYHYFENEGKHTWGQWQKDLPRAIQTIFGK